MLTVHEPSQQFSFKTADTIQLENYVLYRTNKVAKEMINNRHDLKMSEYNRAGYGYAVFDKQGHSVAWVWLLNQVTAHTTYVRVSRYESTANGHFIAVLSELNDMLNSQGYSLVLKTMIPYAQRILNMNFVGKLSKASHSKRGSNDRSTKDVSVEGFSYDLSERTENYNKYHKTGTIEA